MNETQAMSLEAIQTTVKAFEHAAERAKAANFDIVEIHAALPIQSISFLQLRKAWNRPLFVRISTDK